MSIRFLDPGLEAQRLWVEQRRQEGFQVRLGPYHDWGAISRQITELSKMTLIRSPEQTVKMQIFFTRAPGASADLCISSGSATCLINDDPTALKVACVFSGHVMPGNITGDEGFLQRGVNTNGASYSFTELGCTGWVKGIEEGRELEGSVLEAVQRGLKEAEEENEGPIWFPIVLEPDSEDEEFIPVPSNDEGLSSPCSSVVSVSGDSVL